MVTTTEAPEEMNLTTTLPPKEEEEEEEEENKDEEEEVMMMMTPHPVMLTSTPTTVVTMKDGPRTVMSQPQNLSLEVPGVMRQIPTPPTVILPKEEEEVIKVVVVVEEEKDEESKLDNNEVTESPPESLADHQPDPSQEKEEEEEVLVEKKKKDHHLLPQPLSINQVLNNKYQVKLVFKSYKLQQLNNSKIDSTKTHPSSVVTLLVPPTNSTNHSMLSPENPTRIQRRVEEEEEEVLSVVQSPNTWSPRTPPHLSSLDEETAAAEVVQLVVVEARNETGAGVGVGEMSVAEQAESQIGERIVQTDRAEIHQTETTESTTLIGERIRTNITAEKETEGLTGTIIKRRRKDPVGHHLEVEDMVEGLGAHHQLHPEPELVQLEELFKVYCRLSRSEHKYKKKINVFSFLCLCFRTLQESGVSAPSNSSLTPLLELYCSNRYCLQSFICVFYNFSICSSSVTTVPDHDGSVLADPIPADTDDTGADLTAAAACHHLLMAIPTVHILHFFLFVLI